MPAYDFENKDTGETIRILCSSTDKEKALAAEVENPENWRPLFKVNFSTAGGRTSIMSRTSDGFKDRLKAIKAANPGSTINI